MPSATKPATYTLTEDTAHFDLRNVDLGDVDLWLGDVLNLTRQVSSHPAVVGELRRRIENGLAVLRDGDSTGETVRAAAEGAIVAALVIGFHHTGGPAGARKIEAEMKVRQDKQRIENMNAGRRRSEEVVEFIRSVRDEHLAHYPNDASELALIARVAISKVETFINQGAHLSSAVKSYFKTSEKDKPKRQERVRRLLRDLDK